MNQHCLNNQSFLIVLHFKHEPALNRSKENGVLGKVFFNQCAIMLTDKVENIQSLLIRKDAKIIFNMKYSTVMNSNKHFVSLNFKRRVKYWVKRVMYFITLLKTPKIVYCISFILNL